MNQPTLYILCGLPFSGKTTLAKKLSKEFGCEIVAFDWIWAETYPDETPDLDKIEGWKQIRSLAKERISKLLQSGKSVVYDEINPRVEHREELKRVGNDSGADTRIIFVDIPIDEIKRRKEFNLQTKERHDVAPHNFTKAVNDFKQPIEDEEFFTITLNDNIEEWIQKLKVDR